MGIEIHRLTAQDGAELRWASNASFADKPAATVVLLGGRAEFIEKHEHSLRALEDRNFLFYTMDWRGQGLSSRLLEDRHKGYIHSFSQYVADLDRFVKKVVLPHAVRPVFFLAHSMGGHISLRYLGEKQPPISGAVLVSPMLDICTFPMPRLLVRGFARMAVSAGLAAKYIPGDGPYDPENKPFANNPLTSDRQQFMQEHEKIAQNPDLALGGVTYGWLLEAFRSIDRLSRSSFLRNIKTRVLMAYGGCDRVVSAAAIQRACEKLPRCRCIGLPRARHEILNEAEQIRRAFWREFDQWVQSAP
ncbi:MAG: alpha/beta fold hydrolase [Desulfosalsimonadaceae bacterium]